VGCHYIVAAVAERSRRDSGCRVTETEAGHREGSKIINIYYNNSPIKGLSPNLPFEPTIVGHRGCTPGVSKLRSTTDENVVYYKRNCS